MSVKKSSIAPSCDVYLFFFFIRSVTWRISFSSTNTCLLFLMSITMKRLTKFFLFSLLLVLLKCLLLLLLKTAVSLTLLTFGTYVHLLIVRDCDRLCYPQAAWSNMVWCSLSANSSQKRTCFKGIYGYTLANSLVLKQ